MRLVFLLLVFLVGCGDPGVCPPTVATTGTADLDVVWAMYDAAQDVFGSDVSCGVEVKVLGLERLEDIPPICGHNNLACTRGGRQGTYSIVYAEDRHLRHEWIHILMTEADIPDEDHHDIMHELDIYHFTPEEE